MESTKHTPGPWRISEYDNGYLIGAYDGSIALTTGRAITIKKYKNEREANARLIAAAPELLEALSAVTNNYIDTYGDEGNDAPESIKVALATIAKAEGR